MTEQRIRERKERGEKSRMEKWKPELVQVRSRAQCRGREGLGRKSRSPHARPWGHSLSQVILTGSGGSWEGAGEIPHHQFSRSELGGGGMGVGSGALGRPVRAEMKSVLQPGRQCPE